MCTLRCRKMCVDSLAQKWDRIILGSAQKATAQQEKGRENIIDMSGHEIHNKLSKLLTLIAVTCRLWWISINNSTLLDPLTGLIRLIRSEKKSRGNFVFFLIFIDFHLIPFSAQNPRVKFNGTEKRVELAQSTSVPPHLIFYPAAFDPIDPKWISLFFKATHSLSCQALCGWSQAQISAEFSGEKGFVFHNFISFRHRGIQSSL